MIALAPTCIGCGVERIGPGIDGQPGERLPCPVCGEIGVHHGLVITDPARVHDMLALKLRGPRDGKRKTLQAGKYGHEWYRKDGRWHHVHRTLDHVNDRYDEVITDVETGEIVRECHESLSEHQGRGSARPK